jgi:hypothetical protein
MFLDDIYMYESFFLSYFFGQLELNKYKDVSSLAPLGTHEIAPWAT